MAKKEESFHISLCMWLKLQYPHVIFFSESSGMRLSIGQAVKLKKLRSLAKGLPDLFIAEPRGKYNGLFLELKRADTKLYKKDGSPVNEHIKEQREILAKLNNKGYMATFGIGFDDTKKIIDTYLSVIK